MKCKHCNSSWDSAMQTEKCPFCGKSLLQNSDQITSLSEGLDHIIKEYGFEILTDSKRLLSLVMDFVPGCDKDKKLFRIAISSGTIKSVIDMVNTTDKEERDHIAKKAIQRLEDEFFLSEDNAYHIFNLILSGASLPILDYKTETIEISLVEGATPIETTKVSIEKVELFRKIKSKISVTDHSVILCADGTVKAVGANQNAQSTTFLMRDIIAISCKVSHTYALAANGSVYCAGDNNYGQCNVDSWKDIVAIDASMNHTVGLKKDGTVVAVGDNRYGQCDVSSWTNVAKIYCSLRQTVGIRKDGTVVFSGDGKEGQGNIASWRDIVKVAVTPHNTIGLKRDGTVVAVGDNKFGQCDVQHWSNIIDIDCGTHTVALRADGKVFATGDNSFGQCNVDSWERVIGIAVRSYGTVAVTEDGHVLAAGSRDNGQLDVENFNDIICCDATVKNTMLVKSDGSIIVIGVNQHGQCNTSDWNIFYNPSASQSEPASDVTKEQKVETEPKKKKWFGRW